MATLAAMLALTGCQHTTTAPQEPVPAFTLIEEGRPQGVIYLPSEAAPVAKSAATELQNHLQKISGAVVPIVHALPPEPATPVILVGPSQAATDRGVTTTGLTSEGYRIKSGDNWLVLLGDDTPEAPLLPNGAWGMSQQEIIAELQRNPLLFNGDWGMPPARFGTLTAVYRFLEAACGVRWFMPGDLGTFCPAASTVRVPYLDQQGTPAFSMRLPRLRGWEDPASREVKQEVAAWMPRVGFGKTAHTHLNHSFYFLTKNQALWQSKPQIFGVLPDGKRDFNTTCYGNGNLCLSEPETLVEFVKMLRSKFDKDPNLREFSINPNDVWMPCMCDTCMAAIEPELRAKVRQAGNKMEGGTVRMNLSHEQLNEFRRASSKLFWNFVVQAARQVQESHPDRLIGVFAGYEGYGDPEVAGQFDLPANIAICITKWRWNFWNQAERDRTWRMIDTWSKLVDHIYIWEYYVWNWRDWPDRPKLAGYPVFFPHILQDDIRFQRDHHVRGEKIQNEGWIGASPGLNHLMTYLTGRLQFNPDLDVNELLEDYYSKFYGPAQKEMQAFWEHAESCWMRDTSAFNRTQVAEIVEILFTVEDLRQFFSLLAQAKAKVAPESLEFRRIDLIEKEMAPWRTRIPSATVLPGAIGAWRFRPDPDDRGITESWFNHQDLAANAWLPVVVPAMLPKQDNKPFIGYGWYSTTFTVPEASRSRNLELFFEAVDEQAWVYVNGRLVGEHTVAASGKSVGQLWEEPFLQQVPAELLAPDGINRVMVRIHNSAAAGGIWKPVHVRVADAQEALAPHFVSAALFPPPVLDGAYHGEWDKGVIDLATCKVKVGHDPQNLYLSFHVREQGKTASTEKGNGGKPAWRTSGDRFLPGNESDTVMIEIQPDPANKEKQFAILVNASGETLAAAYGDPAIPDPRAWKSGVRAAVKNASENGWSGTVAIPWAALGMKLSPGMEIQANISHWRAGKSARYWSLPSDKEGGAHSPASTTKRFGIMSFPEQ